MNFHQSVEEMMIQTVQDHLLMLALKMVLAYVTAQGNSPNSDHASPSAFELCTTADSFDPSASRPPYSRSRIHSSYTIPSLRRLISTQADWLIFLRSSLQQTNGAIFTLSQFMFTLSQRNVV